MENAYFFTNPLDFFAQRLHESLQVSLAAADIQLNGDRPWDIQVHDPRFYTHIFWFGSLGLGESYVEGWWDCSQLDVLFAKLLRNRLQEKIAANNFMSLWENLRTAWLNLQTFNRSFQVGCHHYDLGNDLYEKMLDSSLTYSCGYWRNAGNLEEAQEAKLDLICRKLKLERGMTLLDIGCGWGSLMKYAAQNYGVSCVGITVSWEQMRLGQELCQGLPVQFLLQDYRQLTGEFDRIASVGMIEHVGYKNYRNFMKIAHRCLKEDGVCLLHTIGNLESVTYAELWINKYIFPNGMLPSLAQISLAIEKLFVVEDLHDFGQDYAPTLQAWFKNFEQSWQELKPKYGEKFYRVWKYYLLSLAGAFTARFIQLWQIVLTKKGLIDGYEPVR